MSETEYVQWVKSRLPIITDPVDIECVDSCIRTCFAQGFTKEDARAFTRLTEHVNPDLSEANALRRMKLITDKYPNYGKS